MKPLDQGLWPDDAASRREPWNERGEVDDCTVEVLPLPLAEELGDGSVRHAPLCLAEQVNSELPEFRLGEVKVKPPERVNWTRAGH